MNEGQNVIASLFNDTQVLDLEQVDERVEIDKQSVVNFLRNLAVWLFLLQVSSFVQDFVHDLKQMISAPLLMV